MVAIAAAFGSFVQTPCGPRKSGMPLSVLMPAPVSTVTALASRSHSPIMITSLIPRTPRGPGRPAHRAPRAG